MDNNKKFTELEIIKFTSVVQMLEEALELMGQAILADIQEQMMESSEEENLAAFNNMQKNIYSVIKLYPEELESEYEEFRNDPETIEKVNQMMNELQLETLQITQGEGNDDEGNGNLQ